MNCEAKACREMASKSIAVRATAKGRRGTLRAASLSSSMQESSMKTLQQLESVLVNELARRGLRRAPGPLSFIHRGLGVRVTLKESLYRGLFVSVHDGVHGTQQFRAHDGAYDWDAIAQAIAAVVGRQLPVPAARRAAVAGTNAPLSIRPSTASPGRLRVTL